MKLVLLTALLLASCASLPHQLDDLSAVHEDGERGFSHRFELERYGWFGASLRWGPIGQLLGSYRFSQKSKQSVAAPSEFCAERMLALSESAGLNLYELSESVQIASRVMQSDPYVLSRVFASKCFLEERAWIQPDDLARALQKDRFEDYQERVRLRANELLAMYSLRKAGSGAQGDAAKISDWVSELGAISYVSPSESIAVSRIVANLAFLESGELRAKLQNVCKFLLARAWTQSLLLGLKDPNEFVRAQCLRSLHHFFGRGMVREAFLQLNTDSSPVVRKELARLAGTLSESDLRAIKEPDLFEFLAKASRDADGTVAINAMSSLSRILNSTPVYDREYWRSWWEKYLLRGN